MLNYSPVNSQVAREGVGVLWGFTPLTAIYDYFTLSGSQPLPPQDPKSHNAWHTCMDLLPEGTIFDKYHMVEISGF